MVSRTNENKLHGRRNLDKVLDHSSKHFDRSSPDVEVFLRLRRPLMISERGDFEIASDERKVI